MADDGNIKGLDGFGLITTAVVEVAEHPLSSVAVIVYVPFAADVTNGILGFCKVELNELGPDQI